MLARLTTVVSLSGFRPNETIAAYLWVGNGAIEGNGTIELFTTERPACRRSQPLADRYPESMPLWRHLLGRFDLESDVIDRGWVMG